LLFKFQICYFTDVIQVISATLGSDTQLRGWPR